MEEENDLTQNQVLANALPFVNCSEAQIESDFMGEKKTLYEKYSCSKFFKDMAEYASTFSSNNYSCNYYDINNFNSNFTKISKSYLKMCHINIRSINLHKHELLSYLSCLKYSFDIILLTECGHAIVQGVEECFTEYNFFHNNSSRNKGGSGILIKKNVFDSIDIIQDNLDYTCGCNKCIMESLWIKLSLKKEKIIIGCIYRHPDGNLEHFNDAYTKYIEKLDKKATCMIGGDLNIDLLQFERDNINEYLATNLENNFVPCITLPTRITEKSATIIDHVFLRMPLHKIQTKVNAGNLFCSITDHLMKFTLLETNTKNNKERPYIRQITKKKLKFFLEKSPNDPPLLPNVDNDQQTNSSIHDLFSDFVINLKNMLDKYFPLVKQSRKHFKEKEWINEKLKTDIKKKNILYRKYICKKTENNKKQWKEANYKVTEDIRKAQTQYYRSILLNHNNNSQNLWKTFGKILKNNKNTVKINKIKINQKITTDPMLITNAFNQFFTNIGNDLAKQFENQNKDAFREYLNNPILDSFCLLETHEQEVKNYINKIDVKKAMGYDEMPAKFLKSAVNIIAGPLTKLFNLSIAKGEYPDFLKIAKVLPIYKKGEHTDMNNYRPISVLSHMNKILETIISKQMKNFLNKNNILYKYQYGFRENHSTDHALIEMIDNIKLSVDDKKLAGGIFVDLTKAFDTVNHNILLEKLKIMGFRGIPYKLLESYLTNRLQYVQLGNSKSRLLPIKCGVPQGSVLGPLLFILYINDLANCCLHGKITIFADDTAIYFECSTMDDLIYTASTIMKDIDKWFTANLLTLNTNKSFFCVFRKKNKSMNVPDKIDFNEKSINRAKHIKYLGITLDEHLDWNEHISNLCNSLKSFFSVFYNIRDYLFLENCKIIYYTMVYSKIKYGICVYGFTKNENMKKIQVLQNKLLKVLTAKEMRYSTNKLHNDLYVLQVRDIFLQEITSFVCRYINNKLPDVFEGYFRTFSEVHQYNTRGRENSLLVPQYKSDTGKDTVKVGGTIAWNKLDCDLKNIKIPKSFRKEIKKNILPYSTT